MSYNGDMSLIFNRLNRLEEAVDSLKNRFNENEPDDSFEFGETYYMSCIDGIVRPFTYGLVIGDNDSSAHRIFKTKEEAEEFNKKVQFIADMMWFKNRYDKDLSIIANNECWSIVFDKDNNKYCPIIALTNDRCYNVTLIRLSTKEIAQKCADWLNKKKED